MRVSPRYPALLLAAVAAYLGWVFLSRQLADRTAKQVRETAATEEQRLAQEFLKTYGGTEVRILHFYAANGYLVEDDKATICYGVLNARAVRLEPAVPGVGPALNRCVEDSPTRNTRYTLIAEGKDGSVISESFEVQVRPDPDLLPLIRRFQVVRSLEDRGKAVFVLSFETKNAEEVAIDPPVFPTLRGAPTGRFYIAPEKTTTYTLTAVDRKGRRAQQKLTVEAPASKR